MSKLFNTLSDVLTPYANKINLHTEEIEEIQGDVSDVKADLTAIKSDESDAPIDINTTLGRVMFSQGNITFDNTSRMFANSYAELEPNKTYKVHIASGYKLFAVLLDSFATTALYDQSQFGGAWITGEQTITFTPTDKWHYFRCSLMRTDSGLMINDDLESIANLVKIENTIFATKTAVAEISGAVDELDTAITAAGTAINGEITQLKQDIDNLENDKITTNVLANWAQNRVAMSGGVLTEVTSMVFANSGIIETTQDLTIEVAPGYIVFGWATAYNELGHDGREIVKAWSSGKITYTYDSTYPYLVLCLQKSPSAVITVSEAANGVKIYSENETIFALKQDFLQLDSDLDTEVARAEAEEARIEALFTQPVEEAVNDWLDAHPEATTTIQDGSLDVVKFTDETKAKLIPYGIDFVYDDSTASTANTEKLQDVLDDHPNGVLINFDTSKKLYLDTVNINSSNVYLVGGHINGTFIVGDGGEYTWNNCQNVRFIHMVFDNDDYSKDAIIANTVYRFYVDGCAFKNCRTSVKTDPTSLAHQIIRTGAITNSVLTGLNHALDFRKNGTTYYSVGDLQISNNLFSISAASDNYPDLTADEMDAGYSLYGEKCDGIKIEGNTFFTSGIYLDTPLWSNIQNNNIFNTYARGIYLIKPQAMNIVGNNIGLTGYVFQTIGQGIYVDTSNTTASNLIISNNTFTICLAAGIKFKNVKHAQVSNNGFFDCGGTARAAYAGTDYVFNYESIINIDSDCTDNVFANNKYNSNNAYSVTLNYINDEDYAKNNIFEDSQHNTFDYFMADEGKKNLLPNELTTQTINGLTATLNTDGSITLDGTASANTSFDLFSRNSSNGISVLPLKAGKTYRFFMRRSPVAKMVSTYVAYQVNSGGWNIGLQWNYDVGKWTIPENLSHFSFQLQIPSGETFDNAVIYPMCTPDYITSFMYSKYVTP